MKNRMIFFTARLSFHLSSSRPLLSIRVRPAYNIDPDVVLNSRRSRRRLMPSEDLKALLERIHTRLDESFVGIGQVVADLRAADLAELINELTLSEAGAVVSMLPVARTIEIFDQPTMRRRAGILEQLEPRSEEHTSELQSPYVISYAVFC